MHDLVIDKVALVDAPANKREFLIFKNESAEAEKPSPKEEGTDMDEALKKQLEDRGLSKDEISEISKAMDAGKQSWWNKLIGKSEETPEDKEKANKAILAKAEAIKKEADEKEAKEKKEVEKAASQTAVEKELAEIKKAHQTLVVDLAKEQEIRKTAEYIAKADKYDLVPVQKAELASILRFVEEGDKKQYAVMEKMLDTMQGIIVKSKMFVADSVLGIDAAVGANPESKLTKLVKERIAKADNKMSEDEVMAEIVSENPELYEEHRRSFAASHALDNPVN